ncbi:SNF1-interacting protein [Didymosphaeria variabile]|uniref:SNF1-interacting protein n=1 Tax=Didymosphaeria variabile TaxID=1932322 RepID=A0A9W8XGM5_9PLEO|nr:SNF1-interacting protein [Didymosphaeria variabile]KAJ4350289.1 SNF1-interacting protein [Didymosphaeria variabile]
MGNSQAKESRPASSRGTGRPSNNRQPSSPTASGPEEFTRHGRSGSGVYGNARSGRGSRPDLSFLGIGASSDRDTALEPRRETKAEREARKLEKERQQRAQDRERSIREEGVDGGYLVTLGTYTGPEDFSKPVVRQLQIERRLAPFWKGLNDHEDTWTEHQLVAVVNDKPLPAPDEIPEEEPPRPNNLSTEWNPRTSNQNLNNLTVPMGGRTISQASDRSANLTASHPAFSLPSPTSPIANSPSPSPFFRGRAKTLAALTSGSRNASQIEMAPQEVQLPKDPYVNGQRLEVFLYKDASECPICFLYYPPYLNKTRCCDQPICSECFVQIKRPDPHPPEHHADSNDAGSPPPEPQEDGMLVSEPACCPFCVQPEFGITYEPPPFRRGLVFAGSGIANAASAMSSTSSLNSQGLTSPGRRRAGSLAATDASVITTDRVRPDWAKKLADARAHALRRAAAATALHNAAYMMGNMQSDNRGFSLGRRRRTMFGSDSASTSGNGTPRGDVNALLAAAAAQGSSSRNDGQSDLTSNRQSSRRGNRLEDLEDLMMMEAIRLSLAAEEERKKKEEKEAAKEAKKEEKKKAKEAKKADKAARKSGFFMSPNQDGAEDDFTGSSSSAAGKGKAVDRSGGYAGFNPLNEPTSTLNASSSKDDPQKHLEQSRSTLNTSLQREGSGTGISPTADSFGGEQASHRSALRNLSNASSSASSFAESLQGSLQNDGQGNFGASTSSFGPSPNASGISLDVENDTPPQGTPGTEPMFNFRSLAEVITKEEGKGSDNPQHIENVAEGKAAPDSVPNAPASTSADRSTPSPPRIAIEPPQAFALPALEPMSPLDASMATLKPDESDRSVDDDDEIEPAPRVEALANGGSDLDHKHIGNVSMVDRIGQHQPTQ